ncbi:MAG: prefoldin subunit beta [Candidatus Bathyarchaeota archaeon]|nr:prefoldin subunit beta [Candidatus Bathyarchaeota archaeon]
MGEGTSSLPPQLREQLLRLQQLQRTMEVVVSQKTQLEFEFSDIERALDELEKMDDKAAVYKSVGSLLVSSSRQKVIDELRDRKEIVNTRVTVLARQEERTRKKLAELQNRLEKQLKRTGSSP